MAWTEEQVRREIARLHRSRREHQNALKQIRELLANADIRRKSVAPHELGRWNKMLDALERQMDQAKAVLADVEQRIKRMQFRLERLHGQPRAGASATPPSRTDTLATTGVEDASAHILGIPRDRVSQLGLDEIAELHEQISNQKNNKENSGLNIKHSEQKRQLYKRQEPTRPDADTRQSSSQSISPTFDRIIKTIQRHEIDSLTPEDVGLVRAALERFSQKGDLSPREERLKSLLQAALNIWEKRFGA